MTYLLDRQTGEYVWQCPQCHYFIRLNSLTAVRLADNAEGCQGCRAKKIFRKDPGLIGLFLEFWSKSNNWPQSPSWMEAVPESVSLGNVFSSQVFVLENLSTNR